VSRYTIGKQIFVSCLQKLRLESLDSIRKGSEFQGEGPATENVLLASFVLVLGWAKRPRDAERNVTQVC